MSVHTWDAPALIPVAVWYSQQKILLRDDGCYVPVPREQDYGDDTEGTS